MVQGKKPKGKSKAAEAPEDEATAERRMEATRVACAPALSTWRPLSMPLKQSSDMIWTKARKPFPWRDGFRIVGKTLGQIDRE